MNKILVMGGNGFIGKNIVNYFHSNGLEADIYDLFPASSEYKSYQGNILTDDHLDEIIAQYDIIIYLVTSVSPKKSMDFPETSYTQDIPMLLRVLNSCLNSKCKRVIFSSSGGTVYGECKSEALKEDEVIEQPINHYAVCKVACEKVLQLYNKLYGMENISLRIANPYGVGQNPASGVGVITTFADKIIKGEDINLFGDGNTIRDFINVEFVAEAFMKAACWQFDRDVLPVFNVGSGIPISINEIIQIISEELNVKPNINYLPERPFDVKKNVLSMEKTQKYLGLQAPQNEVEKIREYIRQLNRENYHGR